MLCKISVDLKERSAFTFQGQPHFTVFSDSLIIDVRRKDFTLATALAKSQDFDDLLEDTRISVQNLLNSLVNLDEVPRTFKFANRYCTLRIKVERGSIPRIS